MISRKPYLLRAMLEWAEDNSLTPMIVVDAGVEGVRVPLAYVKDGQITLNVLFSAMAGREVTNEALSGNARFGGRSEFLFVPMQAVSALIVRETGEGMVFADEDEPVAAAPFTGPKSVPKADGNAPADEVGPSDSSRADAGDEPPRPPRGRPQLKIVK